MALTLHYFQYFLSSSHFFVWSLSFPYYNIFTFHNFRTSSSTLHFIFKLPNHLKYPSWSSLFTIYSILHRLPTSSLLLLIIFHSLTSSFFIIFTSHYFSSSSLFHHLHYSSSTFFIFFTFVQFHSSLSAFFLVFTIHHLHFSPPSSVFFIFTLQPYHIRYLYYVSSSLLFNIFTFQNFHTSSSILPFIFILHNYLKYPSWPSLLATFNTLHRLPTSLFRFCNFHILTSSLFKTFTLLRLHSSSSSLLFFIFTFHHLRYSSWSSLLFILFTLL